MLEDEAGEQARNGTCTPLDNPKDVGLYPRRLVGRLTMIEMMKFVLLKKSHWVQCE